MKQTFEGSVTLEAEQGAVVTDGWTAGKVWTGMEAIAKATGEDPDELLEYATDAARRDVIGKEQSAEQVAKDLEKLSRERM